MSFRLRPLPASLVLLGLIVAIACTPAPAPEPAPEPAAPVNPLEGVWSLTASSPGDGSAVIDPSQPGIYIFTDGYYSAVYAPGAEVRALAETAFQPTTEEMVAQHESIIVNTGPYEISGSTVTFRPIIAKSPALTGGHLTSEFKIDGDTLTLTTQTVVAADGVSPPDPGGSLTLQRVE